uniref:Uncharacterized protein n=1 Tax=Oryza sativa subsp. japonica TaxID=39947 RepID=Q6EP80_ORYSJ|nr:hypothetical protein [Oryza sativa Japonica Group]BAD29540.1 hypothetical protein [Oryza sativa Japonica Group]
MHQMHPRRPGPWYLPAGRPNTGEKPDVRLHMSASGGDATSDKYRSIDLFLAAILLAAVERMGLPVGTYVHRRTVRDYGRPSGHRVHGTDDGRTDTHAVPTAGQNGRTRARWARAVASKLRGPKDDGSIPRQAPPPGVRHGRRVGVMRPRALLYGGG